MPPTASSSRLTAAGFERDCGLCTLRPFTPADAAAIAPLLNDRAVWLNLSDRIPHPYLQEHAEAFISAAMRREPAENFAIWADDRLVGGIGLVPGEGVNRVSAEVGYWLGRPFWGRGIMTSALREMTRYAMERLEYTRLFALVFAHNTGSIRTLEKAGYVREGFMKQSAIKDGVIHDEYLYGWYRDRG